MSEGDIARVPLTNRPSPNPGGGPARAASIRATLLAILIANAFVVAIKLAIGIRTGTLAVLGAALESGLDMLNNVMGILLVSLAAQAPDDDHPYGHDKFETLGAIGIVGFLSISCFELARGAFVRLIDPVALASPTDGELLLLASTSLVNVVVVAWERRKGRELSSPLLLADAEHTASDLAVTALAIASLVAARAGIAWADPLLAIVVALIIARSGWLILRVTVPVLVDQRGADSERVRRAACGVPGVRDAFAIRSRTNSSGTVFVDITITVDGTLPVTDAHAHADAVERAVQGELGAADVTVHVEPTQGLSAR